MPAYRGNIGNLLQHWVLCEVVGSCADCWKNIRFIDAYAMAPRATERVKPHWSSNLFDHAAGQPSPVSLYQRTWATLVAESVGYPNSAAFVASIWPGSYTMVLCELDSAAAAELRTWKEHRERDGSRPTVEVVEGDWREAFKRDLGGRSEPWLLSFDPDMYSCKGGVDDGRKMTRADLQLVASALPREGAVVMQLSTYSVNGGNTQAKVIDDVCSALDGTGLEMLAAVKADEQMMSMVLGRDCPIPLALTFSALPTHFDSWLYRLKASLVVATQLNRRPHPAAAERTLLPLPPLPRRRRE